MGKWSGSRLGPFTPGTELPVLTRREARLAPKPVWKRWRREKNPFPAPIGNRAPAVWPVAYTPTGATVTSDLETQHA